MNSSSPLSQYIAAFSRLRRDATAAPYPDAVRGRAPNKPLLLLAVLDLFSEGRLADNLIPLDPALCDLFNAYWSRTMPADWHGDIGLPFYHLTGEGFWHLVPRPGSEELLRYGRPLRTVRALHDHTLGARLDDALFASVQAQDAREALRACLIETHFAPMLYATLREQGRVNAAAYRYGMRLLERARTEQTVREPEEVVPTEEPVRDQGFRLAIVSAYEHRCAFCRIRVRTPDSHTVVEAAHIVPWSISHDDDLRNGMALCRLCHWIFDKGLAGVSTDYKIITASALKADYNDPQHLATLKGHSIWKPRVEYLWPAPERLAQHRRRFGLRRRAG